MIKRICAQNHEFCFLRRRAAQLYEEGSLNEARRLIAYIDREQVRRVACAMKEQSEKLQRKDS